MKKQLLIIVISFISFSFAMGQGTIKGKITDETGESLAGATVRLKANPSVSTLTDFDGFYSLEITDSAPQVIEISYISYQNQQGTIDPMKGEVVIKDFILTGQGVANNMEEAKVFITSNSY